MKPEIKPDDLQTWAGYIQHKLFASFVFSEHLVGVQHNKDVKTGLEEQAQQSSFPTPQKESTSPSYRRTHAQSLFLKRRDSVTPG